MTDRHRIQQDIKRLSYVKTWQLLILLVLVGFVTATFLRMNNNGMIERRTAVAQADKVGDGEALKNNLYSLQRYAAEHMNASSGTMYLDQSYKRDSQKAFETVQAATSQNSEALSKADAACKERFSGWSQSYVQCVVAEQAKYPGTASVSQFVPPDPELYRHEFISPMWSPDFAGFSLIIFLLITVVIVLRIIGLVILKLLLKKHYSSI